VPIAPIAIGVLPVGLISLLGYEYWRLGNFEWRLAPNQ